MGSRERPQPGQHTGQLPRLIARVTRVVTFAALALIAVFAVPAIGLAVVHGHGGHGRASSSPPPPEKRDLTVAVVPAADSAGFFVALHEGLFTRRGLDVHFIPAVSSETVLPAQAAGRIDISCGNYVSYIQAQQAGQVDLDIFAEGSVMEPGAQGLYVLPRSGLTLADLKGRTIGVNAPGNILYLLAASVLAEHGLRVSGVRFAYIPLPQMAAALKAGKVAAAVLPEPFASQAQLSLGVVPLADLDQGATEGFPVQGCAVTRAWAVRYPGTLAAFRDAFEAGPGDRGPEPARRRAGDGGAPGAAGPHSGAGGGDGAGFLPGRPGRCGAAAAGRRRHAPVPPLPVGSASGRC